MSHPSHQRFVSRTTRHTLQSRVNVRYPRLEQRRQHVAHAAHLQSAVGANRHSSWIAARINMLFRKMNQRSFVKYLISTHSFFSVSTDRPTDRPTPFFFVFFSSSTGRKNKNQNWRESTDAATQNVEMLKNFFLNLKKRVASGRNNFPGLFFSRKRNRHAVFRFCYFSVLSATTLEKNRNAPATAATTTTTTIKHCIFLFEHRKGCDVTHTLRILTDCRRNTNTLSFARRRRRRRRRDLTKRSVMGRCVA